MGLLHNTLGGPPRSNGKPVPAGAALGLQDGVCGGQARDAGPGDTAGRVRDGNAQRAVGRRTTSAAGRTPTPIWGTEAAAGTLPAPDGPRTPARLASEPKRSVSSPKHYIADRPLGEKGARNALASGWVTFAEKWERVPKCGNNLQRARCVPIPPGDAPSAIQPPGTSQLSRSILVWFTKMRETGTIQTVAAPCKFCTSCGHTRRGGVQELLVKARSSVGSDIPLRGFAL